MVAQRRVRGVLFIDYVKMLRRHGVDRVRHHLQAEDLAFLSGHLEFEAWYPMETFERFGLTILREIVGTEIDAIRLWGRSQTAKMLSFFSDLNTGEPQGAVKGFAAMLSSLFDFPGVVLHSLTPGALEVKIAYGMSPSAEQAATWQTMGFFEELVTANGGKSVKGAVTGTGFVLHWDAPAKEPPKPTGADRPKVLVVDDEKLVLRAMAKSLEPIAQITAVNSPAAALEALEQQSFHAVLSDHQMGPAGDGLTLLTEISKRWPNTRRILHSGNPPDAVHLAISNGVVHELLVKPAPLDDLWRAVSQGYDPRRR